MPFTLDPTIILTNKGPSPIRDLATVISVSTDNWSRASADRRTRHRPARTTPRQAVVSVGTPTLRYPTGRPPVPPGSGVRAPPSRPGGDFESLSADVADRRRQSTGSADRPVPVGTGPVSLRVHHRRHPVVRPPGDTVRGDQYLWPGRGSPQNAEPWIGNLNVLNLIADPAPASGSVHRLLTDGPVGVGGSGQIRLQDAYENSEMDGH